MLKRRANRGVAGHLASREWRAVLFEVMQTAYVGPSGRYGLGTGSGIRIRLTRKSFYLQQAWN